ncbi:uncharacterized protein LOC127810216 [Diospyros lotus]|uniref:uncharacterized protein LOC127810216 n=1 Tax=Diospyros lotus TaxID=55363 RepID=UPI00224D4333|nr:uncharacterized protein LOC127810216 [Diospyros lotus]
MGVHGPIEVAKVVLEVADVAFAAAEHCHHHREHKAAVEEHNCTTSSEELESLRSENRRLRNSLEENLKLFQKISGSPRLLRDCPPDLHARLVTTVDSEKFLAQLESLHRGSLDGTGSKFPFDESSPSFVQSAELSNVGLEEQSGWVLVTNEMISANLEEDSEIDNENYVVITEEDVVDGIANFMARCILLNRNALSLKPEELQKSLTKALSGANKLEKMVHVWHLGMMFYTLSTCGLAMAALLRPRATIKLATTGVHKTSKLVMKAL